MVCQTLDEGKQVARARPVLDVREDPGEFHPCTAQIQFCCSRLGSVASPSHLFPVGSLGSLGKNLSIAILVPPDVSVSLNLTNLLSLLSISVCIQQELGMQIRRESASCSRGTEARIRAEGWGTCSCV